MTRYAALLRAVNLGSRSRVAMPDLRKVVEGLGHTDVATYLQSGNVVFSAGRGGEAAVAKGIRAALVDELGLDAAVLVRSARDLARVADGNPFADREVNGNELHVTFLEAEPEATDLEAPKGEPSEFALEGREVYLFCPNGYGRTKLNNAFFEKAFGVAATTRNRRTVGALRDMTR